MQRPTKERLAVRPFRIQDRDDEITHTPGPPDVRAEKVNAGRDEQPGNATTQFGIRHHGLELARETALGLVRVRAHAAKLRVRFIDEERRRIISIDRPEHRCHRRVRCDERPICRGLENV